MNSKTSNKNKTIEGIKAITFDFWDTLFIDDSDEPKRKAKGLPSKKEARQQIFMTLLQNLETNMDRHEMISIWDTVQNESRRLWVENYTTPTVADRLLMAFQELQKRFGSKWKRLPEVTLKSPSSQRAIQELEDMEWQTPPDPVPHVEEALATLSQSYRLGIISDTIISPGHKLRDILQDHGLLKYFSHSDHLIFSDEVGRSKPHPLVFEEACRRLEVLPQALAHVGDRIDKDIKGAAKAGAYGILTQQIRKEEDREGEAALICEDLREIAGCLSKL